MLQAETLSFGGQSSLREQERRYQLQRERSEEMRKFLAAQAANTHPRLARIMKKNQDPVTSITETRPSFHLPQIRSGRRQETESQSPSIRNIKDSLENIKSESQRQTSVQQQPEEQGYLQGKEPFYGYPFQPPPSVFPTGYQQYQPYQQYHPNPYFPPINQFMGFGGSTYHPGPFPTSQYPQPPIGQPPGGIPGRNRNFGYPNGYGNGNSHDQDPHQQLKSPHRDPDSSQSGYDKANYGRRQDTFQSKEQYAAELERQIKEKEERKRTERSFRAQPESGFLGDTEISKNNVKYHNGSRDGMGNNGYHGQSFNRSQQQSVYLRELDEQIRIKKEMQGKEKASMDRGNFSSDGFPYPPGFAEGRRGSRKQFPTETAKIFNSMVFPYAAQHGSPVIGSKYAPLPNIQSSNDNLPSLFPPHNNNELQTNIDLGASNFVRGATHVSQMTSLQKDEFITKQDMKRRNQLEIQDALKEQIAEKEYLKRKKIADERAEDEKERLRIEKEQAMLKERYLREKEEARLKEEQDMREKQAAIAEKNARKKQLQEDIPVPQKARKVVRRPSPEPLAQPNPDPQPFRSNSPPLPAVLKKMREEGIEYIPPAPAAEKISEKDDAQDYTKESENEDVRESLKEATNIVREKLPSKPPSRAHSISRSMPRIVDNTGEDDVTSSRQLLEQLEAIQRELQNEDAKLRNEIQSSTQEAVFEYDKNRFESELEEINFEINKEVQPKKWEPTLEPKKVPLPPRQPKSAQFKRYRDIVTPKSISHTPPLYQLGSRNQLDTESQILSITKNMQRLSYDFSISPVPTQDIFNIDEIEKRNEARLKKLQNDNSSSAINTGDDLIARFMARQNSGDRSIPTSPSTFHPIPLDQIEL